jgi:D-alanine-D-alanine ligase
VSEKLRLGVIFGGRSGEHEISLMSARSILSALDREKYELFPIGITHEGHWLMGEDALRRLEEEDLQGLKPAALLGEPDNGRLYTWEDGTEIQEFVQLDVVFPVLHGSYGEDGTIQGLLELADVPYVGAGVLASSIAMDKGIFKYVMWANHIRSVAWTVVLSSRIESDIDSALLQAEAVAPYPLFTKPANMGSSVGVSKCRARSDLMEGLLEAARYDRRVVVEQGIDSREIEVSVLGNEDPEASIPGEIIPSDEFYSYRAKYIDDTSELLIPAPIDETTAEEARRMAIEAYKAIDGAGMARVDFLMERESGRLYLNEINTIPGFTKISMYPKLWEASGLAYGVLVDKLIALALERQAQKERLVRRYGV